MKNSNNKEMMNRNKMDNTRNRKKRRGVVGKEYLNRNDRTAPKKDNKEFDDQVEGRNSVLELLESGKDINKIFITRGEKQGSINKIIAKAKENRIIIVEVDKNKLDEMSGTRSSSRCYCNCAAF